jgi:hypothetical protein
MSMSAGATSVSDDGCVFAHGRIPFAMPVMLLVRIVKLFYVLLARRFPGIEW